MIVDVLHIGVLERNWSIVFLKTRLLKFNCYSLNSIQLSHRVSAELVVFDNEIASGVELSQGIVYPFLCVEDLARNLLWVR